MLFCNDVVFFMIGVRCVVGVLVCVLGDILCVCSVHCMLCFFFQAEDGIRDLVRSRGLGDVYKRQTEARRWRRRRRGARRSSGFSTRRGTAPPARGGSLSLIHI